MMRNIKTIAALILMYMGGTQHSLAQDWANLKAFKEDNVEIGMPKGNEQRVVFMGNSITIGWLATRPGFFKGKNYINRGIGGQTTPQMLLRFRQDVIDLRPRVVVILAGINDIAENTGKISLNDIAGNIASMVELAKAHNITPIISSVLPAFDFPWRPGLEPYKKVPVLNKMLKSYAKENNVIYVDYFSAMVDKRNGLPKKYASDEVHPTKEGYMVMEPLVETAIKKAL